MCGRLACTLCPDDIPKACGLTNNLGKQVEPTWKKNSEYIYQPFYNGPPTTTVPVLIYEVKSYSLVPMKWGFTPSFPVNPQALAHTHNARVENVITSSMYKGRLTSNGRCVIVAEGFYEWQTTPGVGNKQPYFIYQDPYENEGMIEGNVRSEKYLMKMAGLWTSQETDDGFQYSCTMFTTESDSTLSWLHHRMPIILNTQDEINDWLDYDRMPYNTILTKIKKPFLDRSEKEYKLKYYTVDKNYVNKTSCNEEKCMARITLKRTNTLDSWLTAKKKK